MTLRKNKLHMLKTGVTLGNQSIQYHWGLREYKSERIHTMRHYFNFNQVGYSLFLGINHRNMNSSQRIWKLDGNIFGESIIFNK